MYFGICLHFLGTSWYMVDGFYGTYISTWLMDVMVHALLHGLWMLWHMFEAYLDTWFMDMAHDFYMDDMTHMY